jgi:hypothetical protein
LSFAFTLIPSSLSFLFSSVILSSLLSSFIFGVPPGKIFGCRRALSSLVGFGDVRSKMELFFAKLNFGIGSGVGVAGVGVTAGWASV